MLDINEYVHRRESGKAGAEDWAMVSVLNLLRVQDPVMKQKDMPPKQYMDRKNKGEKVAQC